MDTQPTKLIAKDYITAGIFSVLSFVLMLVASVANLTPYTYLFYPALFAFLNGTVFLIVMAKIPKKGAVLLFHIVPFIYMALTGVFGILNSGLLLVFSVLAELIIGSQRKNIKRLTWAYVVLCGWMSIGSEFEMFVFPELYCNQMAGIGMDASYVDAIRSLASNPIWWIISICAAALTALAGIAIGRKFMKKHLVRAGIV